MHIDTMTQAAPPAPPLPDVELWPPARIAAATGLPEHIVRLDIASGELRTVPVGRGQRRQHRRAHPDEVRAYAVRLGLPDPTQST